MDKLNETTEILWDAHARIWTLFDEAGNRGNKDQPADVKRLLREIEHFVRDYNPDLLVDWDAAGPVPE